MMKPLSFNILVRMLLSDKLNLSGLSLVLQAFCHKSRHWEKTRNVIDDAAKSLRITKDPSTKDY